MMATDRQNRRPSNTLAVRGERLLTEGSNAEFQVTDLLVGQQLRQARQQLWFLIAKLLKQR